MANPSNRVAREARLRWVPIPDMKVNPSAQQELVQSWVDHLAANLDLEQLGTPTVNHRDGSYYVMDGQHRIEALRAIGYGDQQVQCWCYEGLTEIEEAETFLKLNNRKTVLALPKFRVAVHAGRETESDIDRIVRAQQLVVSADEIPGAIRAVGTLRRVYTRSGPVTLGRTLRIIRDAYGDSGLTAPVIDGIGLLCQRYNGQLDEATAVTRLSSAHGGANGLLSAAEVTRRRTGSPKAHCVAATAVEIINRGKGGQKLPSWWKSDES